VPDATFWIGEDLGVLADALGRSDARPLDPLTPLTVVVPNSLVGQWLEQSLARASGRFDGVAANLDVILPATFVGRALYDDPVDLERWDADGFALAMLGARRDSRELTVSEAWRRAERLTDVLYWRPEQLNDYLSASGNERERAVVTGLGERGHLAPWTALDDSLDRADAVFGGRLVLFDCGELTTGDLVARVVARLAERTRVDGYFALTSSHALEVPTADRSDASLNARWSAGVAAHLQRWRDTCPMARWELLEAHRRTGAMRTEIVARLAATSAPAAMAQRMTDLVEVHGAVGYARQVEIARDAILAAIDEIGGTPHDVRVVTTDAERFVALMNEYWTRHADPGAPSLQFEIADASLAHASARLRGFSTLLATVASHATIYDVVALLSEPALQDGVGLTREGVERIVELALAGGVSLGLDGRSRGVLGAFSGDDDAGTWGRLRDRGVLASVFDADADADAGAGADDAVLGLAIYPVGVPADLAVMTALSRVIDGLADASAAAGEPRTLAQWVAVFSDWARLVSSPPGVVDVGLERVFDRLHGLVRASEGSFSFDEARELFERASTHVGGSSVLGRGGVTVLGPYALSRAPYRVTCVLGLDDELLPSQARSGAHLGEPRAGDPSPRDRFRAALASLIATTSDRVIVLTNDRDVGDGSSLAPALVLAELTEALAGAGPDGVGVRVPWRHHPRHAFSTVVADPDGAIDLADGTATDARPFSLDATAATVATSLAHRPAPSLEDDLAVSPSTLPDVAPPPVVELARLVQFVKDPQASFLQTVYGGAAVAEQRAELPDVPRLDVGDGLERWRVRRAIVRRAFETGDPVRSSVHPDDPVASVAAGFREGVRRDIGVDALAAFVERHRADLTSVRAVRAPWSERPARLARFEPRLVRPAIEVFETRAGSILVVWTVSSRFDSALADATVTMAVATVERDTPVTALLVRPDYKGEFSGRNPYLSLTWRGDSPVRSATELLEQLTALYRGQFEAMPLHFFRTSLAGSGRDDLEAIIRVSPREAWEGGWAQRRGERELGANRLLLPFSYGELLELQDRAFVGESRRVRRLLDDVVVTLGASGGPAWPEALLDAGLTP